MVEPCKHESLGRKARSRIDGLGGRRIPTDNAPKDRKVDLRREVNEFSMLSAHAEPHQPIHLRRDVNRRESKQPAGPFRLPNGLRDSCRELLPVNQRQKAFAASSSTLAISYREKIGGNFGEEKGETSTLRPKTCSRNDLNLVMQFSTIGQNKTEYAVL